MGGSVSAIEEGYMQNEIATASYKYQKDIESQEKVIVGVNKFTVEEEVAHHRLKLMIISVFNKLKS